MQSFILLFFQFKPSRMSVFPVKEIKLKKQKNTKYYLACIKHNKQVGEENCRCCINLQKTKGPRQYQQRLKNYKSAYAGPVV